MEENPTDNILLNTFSKMAMAQEPLSSNNSLNLQMIRASNRALYEHYEQLK